jgi:hypothetical protein
MPNATPLSKAEISQDLCQKRSLEAVNSTAIFGYTFGYRHQFASFTLNYAKLLSSMDLVVSEITLNYAYLS